MSYISEILRKLLPWRWYKLLANGWMVVPAYYRTHLQDAEKYFDLALEDTDGKELLLMRKYGHILDKGLHRKDTESGHSKNIYLELKSKVERMKSVGLHDELTVKWAESKLRLYEKLQLADGTFTPLEGEKEICAISFEQIAELIKLRRSNRSFSNKLVSDDDVTKLIELVHWAANSCNKQPIELFVTNDPVIAKKCLKCFKGGTGFSEYIPSFWVFAADVRGYVWPSEMYLPTLDTSLGAQNVFLAATTLGISGTILSWGQKDEHEEKHLRNILNIPEYYSIIFGAVMGYAESTFIHPQRKTEE